jgi:hypothetical protein
MEKIDSIYICSNTESDCAENQVHVLILKTAELPKIIISQSKYVFPENFKPFDREV